MPWIHKCATKTAGCGKSVKHTNIHILQCTILRTFYKTMLQIICAHKKFTYVLNGVYL